MIDSTWSTDLWIHGCFSVEGHGGVVTLSDILFMAVKEFGGKKVQADGTQTTTGDLCSLTTGAGKDLYLAKAKINGYTNNTTSNVPFQVVLKVNDNIFETFDGNLAGDSSSEGDFNFDYEFGSLSNKITAGQIIKLEVISIGTNITVNGKFEGWQEDPGTYPSI